MLTAAATCIDLAWRFGVDVMPDALRRGWVTPDGLAAAARLARGRHGQAAVRQMLRDAECQPWSVPERDLHRALRARRIGGWLANRALVVGDQMIHPDLQFPAARLVVEIDGRGGHDPAASPEAFERDRRRDRMLTLAGWTVLRFTAAQVLRDPHGVAAEIMRVLAMLDKRTD